jgi:hypothetical protein
MHHDKGQQQQQPKDRDQRQANPQQGNRDMSKERNEEETGKPVQLDKEGKDKEQHGTEHQGGQQRRPETERRPDQGQHSGQRTP